MQEKFRSRATTSNLVRVAKTPAPEAPVRVNNGFVDRVIPVPADTVIVEAKERATSCAMLHPQLHSSPAVRASKPALRLNRLIFPAVQFAESDPDVKGFAQSPGCRVTEYAPPWIAD
jgi:hypothetical protein